MERHITLFETVIALYDHQFVTILFRHLHLSYLHIHVCFKEWGVYYRFAANRTGNACFWEVTEAFTVHSMATSQEWSCIAWILHICHTDNAILLKSCLHTSMILFQCKSETAPTVIAVKNTISGTNTAYTTLITMVDSLFLSLIVIQRAYLAIV